MKSFFEIKKSPKDSKLIVFRAPSKAKLSVIICELLGFVSCGGKIILTFTSSGARSASSFCNLSERPCKVQSIFTTETHLDRKCCSPLRQYVATIHFRTSVQNICRSHNGSIRVCPDHSVNLCHFASRVNRFPHYLLFPNLPSSPFRLLHFQLIHLLQQAGSPFPFNLHSVASSTFSQLHTHSSISKTCGSNRASGDSTRSCPSSLNEVSFVYIPIFSKTVTPL